MRYSSVDEGILTDSSDASKPAGSPDARSGAESQINTLHGVLSSYRIAFFTQVYGHAIVITAPVSGNIFR